MSRQVSRSSAVHYQADEQAGVARLSWQLSEEILIKQNIISNNYYAMTYKMRNLENNKKLLEGNEIEEQNRKNETQQESMQEMDFFSVY